jgi:hypothetical protein
MLENKVGASNYSDIVSAIDSTGGVKNVIEGQPYRYWRVDTKKPAVWDNSDYERALNSTKRAAWILFLFAIVLAYILLATPVLRRKDMQDFVYADNQGAGSGAGAGDGDRGDGAVAGGSAGAGAKAGAKAGAGDGDNSVATGEQGSETTVEVE